MMRSTSELLGDGGITTLVVGAAVTGGAEVVDGATVVAGITTRTP